MKGKLATMASRLKPSSMSSSAISRCARCRFASGLGRVLGERWNFPAALVQAVGSHHDEGLSREDDGLSWVLMQANRLALHYGLFCGYEPGEEFVAESLPDELAEIEQFVGGIEAVLDRAVGFVGAASGQSPEDEEAA